MGLGAQTAWIVRKLSAGEGVTAVIVRRKIGWLKIFTFLVLFFTACPACSWGQVIEHSIKNGREMRKYYVYIPQSYSANKRVPLVIVLHGGGGNHQHGEKMSGMDQRAEKQGFIVAYPDGSGRLKSVLTWNATHCCGYAIQSGAKDIAFVDKMIDQIAANYSIDEKKVYVTGMSNGAMLAYQVGTVLSHKVAAVGAVVGAMFGDESSPTEPISVIMFNGTQDQHVPFEGGYSKVERVEKNMDRPYLPTMKTFAFWSRVNDCRGNPTSVQTGNVEEIRAQGCSNGTEVVQYKLYGAGHAWPGGQKGSRWADEPTQDISATDAMLDFFMRHPKRSS